MRRRPTGAHARVYESIDDHPKTRAAAAVLAAGVPGLSEDLAAAVIVRAVRRLVCWAIRESDTGRTGHLSDGALARVAWPGAVSPGGALWGAVDVGVLRRALRAVPEGYEVGFLFTWGRGKGRQGVEHIHEFQAHAWHALKDREHYRGCSVSDFDDGPLGRLPAARPPVPELEPAPGASDAPPGSPAVLGAPAAPPAPPAGLEAPSRPAGGGGEVGSRFTPRFGGSAERKPLQGNGPARRAPEGDRFALICPSESPTPDGQKNQAPRPLPGPGWDRVPGGVFAGEAPAVAAWARTFGAFSKAGLHDGYAYVSRWTEASGLQPAPGADDAAVTPGRALELLVPEAFDALVADLTAHLPGAQYPRTYTARALAGRWTEVLSKMADAAQRRRSTFRTGTGGFES